MDLTNISLSDLQAELKRREAFEREKRELANLRDRLIAYQKTTDKFMETRTRGKAKMQTKHDELAKYIHDHEFNKKLDDFIK